MGVLRPELFPSDAGESPRALLPVLDRADARDFRRPCADEGRPGGLTVPATAAAGGEDGDHGFPDSSASS